MNIEQHIEMARRIERSLEKCGPADHEMRIEAAMLAGTHWLNAALHGAGATAPAADIFHTYLLTVNEFRRLCIADGARLRALAEIEDLRPPFVRGNWHGGEHAGERALALLAQIRSAVDART